MKSQMPSGIVKVIQICFPRAARQRCLAHRMRNLAAKVPEDVCPDFKVRAQAAYQAPSRAIARELAAGVVADDGRKYDSAVACFMDDFEACIAHLRFPVTHLDVHVFADEIGEIVEAVASAVADDDVFGIDSADTLSGNVVALFLWMSFEAP